MTEAQMRELVSATMLASWPAASGNLPLVLENEARSTADSFAMLTITLTTSGQMTLGGVGTRRVRRDGWIQVKLWVPADAGAARGAALADAVRGYLEMVSLPSPLASDEPVVTAAATTMPIGIDGRWYMTLLRLPFWYVQTK